MPSNVRALPALLSWCQAAEADATCLIHTHPPPPTHPQLCACLRLLLLASAAGEELPKARRGGPRPKQGFGLQQTTPGGAWMRIRVTSYAWQLDRMLSTWWVVQPWAVRSGAWSASDGWSAAVHSLQCIHWLGGCRVFCAAHHRCFQPKSPGPALLRVCRQGPWPEVLVLDAHVWHIQAHQSL
jgi:hypothetical protein